MKYCLGLLFILTLTACDSKGLTELQETVKALESLVTNVTEQHDTLQRKIETLQTQIEFLKIEKP